MTEIKRDRYGRPMVVPPAGGKPVPYTRATTVAGTLDDGVGLVAWKLRMAAQGLIKRPDLMLAATVAVNDKQELDRLIETAQDAAGSTHAATIGTALHALTEKYDRGEEFGYVPAMFAPDIEAYIKATREFKMEVIEQFCVLDSHQIAGTPDRIVTYRGKRYIFDLKTGSIDYPHKMAIQLAIYSRAVPYNIATGERGSWGEVDTQRGIILHLPAGEGKADIQFVDIDKGWEGLELAMQVRAWRTSKKIMMKGTDE